MLHARPFYQILWFCAGFSKSDREQLEQEAYHLDHSKYAGIGAAVLLTALLATLTGAYAWTVAIGTSAYAYLFGLLWGIIIFNIDRLAVNVSGNAGLLTLLPRIVLALAIAAVLAAPIEILVFKKEIDAQLQDDLNDQALQLERDLAPLFKRTGPYEKELQEMQNRLNTSEVFAQKMEQAAIDECDGSGGSRQVGIGPLCKLKRERSTDARAQHKVLISELSGPIAHLKAQVASIYGDIEIQKAMSRDAKRAGDGMIARLDALHRRAGRNNTIAVYAISLALLLALLEVIPVVLKALTGATRFDAYRQETLVRARINQVEMSNRERIDQRSVTEKIGLANAADIAIYRHQLESDIEERRAKSKALPRNSVLPSAKEIRERGKIDSLEESYNADCGREVQTLLATLGFYKGAIDGIIGDATTEAIRQFEGSIGLKVTGEISLQLMDKLKISAKLGP